jgi:RHS repeat-associated protein
MIGDQNGNTLIYDGWNRLVKVTNSSGQIIAQYSYNALNYAVTVTYPQGNSQIPAGTTNYIYYSNQWQAIEVRTGGTSVSDVSTQIVWSAAYVNAAVLQDSYASGVIQPDSRLYFLQDANWDTTAVVGYDPTSGTWNVVQRYVYDGYGNITILNTDWSATPSGTQPVVNSLYQGMQYDPITGLYYGRARWYSTSLGRWISQDPAGYVNGANAYQFVVGDPIGWVDPSGGGWQGLPWWVYVLTPENAFPCTKRLQDICDRMMTVATEVVDNLQSTPQQLAWAFDVMHHGCGFSEVGAPLTVTIMKVIPHDYVPPGTGTLVTLPLKVGIGAVRGAHGY